MTRIAPTLFILFHFIPIRMSDTETRKSDLRPTTADANTQLLTNINYFDSLKVRVASAVQRYELHIDI